MSKIHCKDCMDWYPLEDGTSTGDTVYCNLSLQCKQIRMLSHWYNFRDENGDEQFDYFCTGMYVTEETKKQDDEVS